MKKYRQAASSYHTALDELNKLTKIKANHQILSERTTHFLYKLKMKSAMCSYYQGRTEESEAIFNELNQYYKKFDPHNLKVQAKSIKCNFYTAKLIIAQKERDGPNCKIDYQKALKHLTFCCCEEIDPELHELYNGNSLFEAFKIFIKNKDIYNSFEYL